jgi:muramoyltetrapeptide carboxypeptidase
MKRREILKITVASLMLPMLSKGLLAKESNNKIIKPKALKQGDTVGIIAPATAVTDPDDIQKAIQVLEYFGLKYKIGNSLKKNAGYKSRLADDRVYDLLDFFEDSEINGIFCIRGGYGSAQILDKIDYEIIKKNPKIFLGYSDITALHLAITQNTGLVTFHGPVLLSSFSSITLESFKKTLFSTEPIGTIFNPKILSGIRPMYPIRTIKEGSANGRLTGGNLSIICSLMGTPFEIDTKDKILFIEDVGEEPYRIDRMLTQLNLAGKLKQAKGIVFGKCAGCDFSGLNSSRIWDSALGEVLDYQLGNLNIPVFYGLLIGHTNEQFTLPYGIESEINSELGELNILEAGVV